MRVELELLAPGMEPGPAAHLRAQMLRILGDVLEGGGNGPKEEPIELARVVKRQG